MKPGHDHEHELASTAAAYWAFLRGDPREARMHLRHALLVSRMLERERLRVALAHRDRKGLKP